MSTPDIIQSQKSADQSANAGDQSGNQKELGQAVDRFFSEYFEHGKATAGKPVDKPAQQAERQPQPQSKEGSDQSLERASYTPKDGFLGDKDPYEHVRNAQMAAVELHNLQAQDKPNDALIRVDDNQGGHMEKVGDRIALLQKFVRGEMQTAITRSDAIAQTRDDAKARKLDPDSSVEALQAKFGQDPNKDPLRQQLAKQFGFDPRTVTIEDLDKKFTSPSTSQADRAALKQLATLQQEYEDLQHLRLAPSSVRLQHADILASGMLNPDRDGAKAGIPSPADASEAYSLVRSASQVDRSGEVRNSAEYQQFRDAVNARYEQSQPLRCQQVINEVAQAENLEKSGDKQKAEALYKDAAQQADQIDLRLLASEYKNQRTDEARQKIQDLIGVSAKAKYDYARFLTDQGRNGDAVAMLAKVQADMSQAGVPQVTDNDDAFQKLMARATGSRTDGAAPSETPLLHLMKAQQLIGDDKKNYDPQQALQEIQKAKELYAQMDPKKVQAEVDALKKQSADLAKQQQDLAKDSSLSADEKAQKQAYLDQELQTTTGYLQLAQSNQGMKDTLPFMEAYTNYLAGNYETAHAQLLQLQKDDPQYAANPDLHMDDLLNQTEGGVSGWYYRNKQAIKKGVVIGAAVIAAAGAAAATFYTGPGAALAATGTFGAVMAGGSAILIGTAAGTLTGVAGEHFIMGNKVTMQTVGEYAGLSATVATAVVAPGLAGKLGLGATAWSTKLGISAAITLPSAISGQVNEVRYHDKSIMAAVRDGAVSEGVGALGGSFFPGGAGRVAAVSGMFQVATTEVIPKVIIPVTVDGYHTYWTGPDKTKGGAMERQAMIRNPKQLPLPSDNSGKDDQQQQ